MSEVSNIFPKNAPEQLNEMTKGLNSVNDALTKLLETRSKQSELLKNVKITYAQVTEAQKGAVKVSQELTKQETTIKKNAEAINALNKNRAKTIAAQKVALQAKNKELKDSARLEAATSKAQKQNIIIATAQKGAYNELTAALVKNVATWKSLPKAQREGTKGGRALTAAIRSNENALKGLDDQIGRSQRKVGSYKDALKGIATQLLSGLGVVAGLRALSRILKSSFQTIAKFDQAQATLASTLGKTKDEIEDLTESSIELGRVTQFTATQVSTLQNELAKLGFTANEIKAATGGILDFAAATGAELGDAASVAGGALKAFGLAATQIDRVVSVMAVSTTKSALQFSDFSTILGTAAPIANKYGLEIEDMVAVMGKLRDAQFDASSASTAFRNILLKLSDPASEISKRFGGAATTSEELFRRLKVLKDEGANLAEILKITDVRAAGAFSTMIDNVGGINTLKDSITGVNDELADMVETKTDNVIGATARLGSAWEGLVLKFRSSSGFFTKVLDELATSINAVNNENISKWRKGLESYTLGLSRAASNQQLLQDNFTKNLRTASIKDIKFTLEKNKKKFDSDTDYWNNLKRLALERIATLEETETDSTVRIAQEKKDAEDALLKGKADFEAKIVEMNKTSVDKEIDGVNKKYATLITEAQSYGVDITELEQMQADEIKQIRLDAEKEANDEIKKERDKYYKDLRALNKQFVKDNTKDNKLEAKEAVIDQDESVKARIESQDLLEVDKLERRNKERLENKKTVNEVVSDERQKQADTLELISLGAEAASAIAGALSERKQANLQREFDVLMLQKEAELSQENLTAEQKQKIEETYAKKAAAIKTKQAKAERRAAVVSVAIDTAVAVAKVWGQTGIFGIVAQIPVLIMGALQAGIIASQPIPKFFGGTKSTPDEFIAGDKQGGGAAREILKLRSGKVMMVNEPTHFKGNEFKGATVIKNSETEKIVSQAERQGSINYDMASLKGSVDALHETMRNKPTWILDEDHRVIGDKTNNSKNIYLNKLMRK